MSLPLVLPSLALLVVTLAVAAPPAEVVRLRDGSLVHGKLTAFDEGSGVTLLRADTGGVLQLLWEHLPPDEVRRIKAARGFTGEQAQPWMVDVVHLIMRNGTTETGVVKEEGGAGKDWVLARRGALDRFAPSLVGGVEAGQVEGLEVFTPEDLYLEIVAGLGPAVGAPSHLALAVACEGAQLYEAARDHFLAVRELDPRLKPELVASRLALIAIKLEDAVETGQLDEIRRLLYRKEFEPARAAAAAFRATYPQSRQKADLLALETEIDQRKQEHYAKLVVGDYHDALERRVDQLARDRALTLDAARELCEGAVHGGILAALGTAYEMADARVEQLWQARRAASVRTATYGDGTFILGKEKALEFGRFDDEGEPAKDPGEEAVDEFESLVEKVKKQREALAQQRAAAARGKVLDDVGPTPDEWWTDADTPARRGWLAAYYYEFSGQLTVVEARARDCRRCSALGTVDGVNEKGEPVVLTCPVCKDLKQERVVRAR